MKPRVQIEPLGDAAVILRVGSARATPSDLLPRLLATKRQLHGAAIAGVQEVTTGYSTVAVFYDPAMVHQDAADSDSAFDALRKQIADVLAGNPRRNARVKARARRVEIPVCYATEFAVDLDEVAVHSRLSADEVVQRHSSAEYQVQCVGFTPGFPYLEGLPQELATPRRATPRIQVPAGSVAIGGSQTGIYPLASPGGWSVIGRTPLKLFAATAEPPALLAAGDRVRFRSISIDEFRAFDLALQSAVNK